MSLPRIVLTSGYFDPAPHIGHLECLEKSRLLAGEGGLLLVIVNNDHQANLKKGAPFACHQERCALIGALRCVDKVIPSIDQDRTVCKTIELVREMYPEHEIVFSKGGDQNSGTIPEAEICAKLGIVIADGLGLKIQSSRWLLKKIKERILSIDDAYLEAEAEPISVLA